MENNWKTILEQIKEAKEQENGELLSSMYEDFKSQFADDILVYLQHSVLNMEQKILVPAMASRLKIPFSIEFIVRLLQENGLEVRMDEHDNEYVVI